MSLIQEALMYKQIHSADQKVGARGLLPSLETLQSWLSSRPTTRLNRQQKGFLESYVEDYEKYPIDQQIYLFNELIVVLQRQETDKKVRDKVIKQARRGSRGQIMMSQRDTRDKEEKENADIIDALKKAADDAVDAVDKVVTAREAKNAAENAIGFIGVRSTDVPQMQYDGEYYDIKAIYQNSESEIFEKQFVTNKKFKERDVVSITSWGSTEQIDDAIKKFKSTSEVGFDYVEEPSTPILSKTPQESQRSSLLGQIQEGVTLKAAKNPVNPPLKAAKNPVNPPPQGSQRSSLLGQIQGGVTLKATEKQEPAARKQSSIGTDLKKALDKKRAYIASSSRSSVEDEEWNP